MTRPFHTPAPLPFDAYVGLRVNGATVLVSEASVLIGCPRPVERGKVNGGLCVWWWRLVNGECRRECQTHRHTHTHTHTHIHTMCINIHNQTKIVWICIWNGGMVLIMCVLPVSQSYGGGTLCIKDYLANETHRESYTQSDRLTQLQF